MATSTNFDNSRSLPWRLDAVAKEIGSLNQGRPLVDLVLNGHAHCLEHLETMDTGHADSHIHWLVCGGSGFSLRRQRIEGADLMEENRLVARSHLLLVATVKVLRSDDLIQVYALTLKAMSSLSLLSVL